MRAIPPSAYSAEQAELKTTSLRDFTYDQSLGRDARVVVLVKWCNTLYLDENYRRSVLADGRDHVNGIPTGRTRNQYYEGNLLVADLSADVLTANEDQYAYAEIMTQPSGIHYRDGLWVVATGRELLVRPDLMSTVGQIRIVDPWFARLHSARITAYGTILTASAAVDLIFEMGLNGRRAWTFDAWEHGGVFGYDTNVTGYRFSRRAVGLPNELVNPDGESLYEPAKFEGQRVAITDPAAYDGLGLPTYVTPAFINSVCDLDHTRLLATVFKTGQGVVIDQMTNTITPVVYGLSRPHGFLPDGDGFIVTDTGTERILFLNPDFSPRLVLSMAEFDDRKPGLGRQKWLQNTTNLGNGLYATICNPRQKITLFDPERRVYRDIPFYEDWGLQTVFPYPSA